MPCCALELGDRRIALLGGAGGGGCLIPVSLPLTLGNRTAPLPPYPRRRFQKASWVGLQVPRGWVA